MKITCGVEVRKISYSANNPRNKEKHSVATLALCQKSKQKESHSEEDAVLILCTQQKPKKRKYKLDINNVDKFKFSKYGKATIRFKEPPHEIIISKADPSQLRRFLYGVGLIVCAKRTGKFHSSPTPTEVDRPKKKLIMKRQDFPLISGFPQSLTWLLYVNTFFLDKINNRILRLQFLEELDLAHSGIKELPLALGEIELKKLRLFHNNIKNFPNELSTGILGQNLQFLDLSFNQIENISPYFCLMKNLTELLLNCNKIKKLPRNMHCLESLKRCDLSHNELKVLPFGIHKLNLDYLNLSYNPLENEKSIRRPEFLEKLPSLFRCAASAIVSQKIQYTARGLPVVLRDYLVEHSPCTCGKNAFQNCALSSCIFLLKHEKLASIVINNTIPYCANPCCVSRRVPVEVYFCSSECWRRRVIMNFVLHDNPGDLLISLPEDISYQSVERHFFANIRRES